MSGGVASNCLLRQRLGGESPVPVLIPEPILCTDNAAMVAACGYFRLQAGNPDGLDMDVIPGLRLV
jgi:N6-L-threonylcarbamoyladenine synthase